MADRHQLSNIKFRNGLLDEVYEDLKSGFCKEVGDFAYRLVTFGENREKALWNVQRHQEIVWGWNGDDREATSVNELEVAYLWPVCETEASLDFYWRVTPDGMQEVTNDVGETYILVSPYLVYLWSI